MSNVAGFLTAIGSPESPALIEGGRTISHAELRDRVAAVATTLVDGGHAKGDRVGLFAENGAFFVEAYLGAIRAGLCVVPFQTDTEEASFRRIARSTAMKTLLVSLRQHKKLLPWASSEGLRLLTIEDMAPPDPDIASRLPPIDPDRDLAALMYTSGSTGQPKGVKVSHRNIEVNTRDIVSYLRLTAADRAMAVLPFFYCYGASLLHTHLAVGGSLVVARSFMFPEKILDEMEREGCTGIAGVPSTFQILLRRTRFKQRSFPRLRWMHQAGGRLPPPLIREIHEAFRDVDFYVAYGQTEATARLSYLPPERLADKLESIGRGLPSTRLEVLTSEGSAVEPGSNQVGEIVASGPNITGGYWEDPEETRRFFRSGKLYTGDLGRVDEDGFIYVVDRARDFIKSMGNRISPREVEEIVAELPAVVEVAVIGVPDDLWGEAIKCVVVARPGTSLTVEEVRAHCVAKLPNHKVPQQIELLDTLPKKASGKIDRVRLRSPQ